MDYKYGGHNYDLMLMDDGQIGVRFEGIVGPDVETVKALIREQNKAQKAAPRIAVLVTDRHDSVYYVGTTAEVEAKDRFGQRWVSYKSKDRHGKEKNERRKVYDSDIFLDTPENRALLDQVISLNEQADNLNRQARDLRDTAKRIGQE